MKHSLLGLILGAAEDKDIFWFASVLKEEFGLVESAREILKNDSWADLGSEVVNQTKDLIVIVTLVQVVFLQEILVVDELSVGALSESLTECGLAGAHWANKESDLGEHCSSGKGPDAESVTAAVNLTDFTELLVHLHNWLGLFLVSLKAIVDNLFSVVSAAC